MDGFTAIKEICEVLHWNEVRIATLEMDKGHLLETIRRLHGELDLAKAPVNMELFCQVVAALDDLSRGPNSQRHLSLLKKAMDSINGKPTETEVQMWGSPGDTQREGER